MSWVSELGPHPFHFSLLTFHCRGPRLRKIVASDDWVNTPERTSGADSGPTIVMLQDFCVSLALIRHDCRADLA
jgi:hypothetical protein